MKEVIPLARRKSLAELQEAARRLLDAANRKQKPTDTESVSDSDFAKKNDSQSYSS